MSKEFIKAGKNLPFSKAIISSKRYRMEISGQIGLNPRGVLEDGIEAQTKQALKNVKKILNEVGWDLNNLDKVRIFFVDIDDYQIVNEIYAKYFKNNFPTRVALAVKGLPLNALIELDCVASGDKIKK